MGHPDRLELTEDEAYALLSLCMTSGLQLDAQSELALKKLASFCKKQRKSVDRTLSKPAVGGFCEAG